MKAFYKVSIVLIFALLIFNDGFTQSPNWAWAKSGGGSDWDVATNIAVDVDGNSYITGYFKSPSVTFGATTLINNNSGYSDLFVIKYDALGNVIWSKSAGGNLDDVSNSIAVDANSNVYITGSFQSPTITFGSVTLMNSGSENVFVTKYDSSGNVSWAKSANGIPGAVGNSIVLDANSNPFITGSFYSVTLTLDSTTLSNVDITGHTADIFVIKYDSSGNVLWAKDAGGISEDIANSITIDFNGNSYVTGLFEDSIIFDNTTLTNAGYEDIFIVKYNSLGSMVWVKNIGGTGMDDGNSIVADANGNFYLTGAFNSDTLRFDSIILTDVGPFDIFIAKYDTYGNIIWAKSSGGIYADYGIGITVDSNGNSYITGTFGSPAIAFGNIMLSNSVTVSFYTPDILIVKYDPFGNVVWAKSAGGIDWDNASGITVDSDGNLYIAGYFNSHIINFATNTLTNVGINKYDTFIAKIGNITAVESEEHYNRILFYPNPSINYCTITASIFINSTLVICDVMGRVLLQQPFNSTTTLNVGKLTNGIYFVEVKDKQGNSVKGKIVKE